MESATAETFTLMSPRRELVRRTSRRFALCKRLLKVTGASALSCRLQPENTLTSFRVPSYKRRPSPRSCDETKRIHFVCRDDCVDRDHELGGYSPSAGSASACSSRTSTCGAPGAGRRRRRTRRWRHSRNGKRLVYFSNPVLSLSQQSWSESRPDSGSHSADDAGKDL